MLSACDTLEPPDDWEESGEHYTSNIELRWSDELYRLLGFVPGTVKPTPEVFLQAVHPEDRELVARSHRLVTTGLCFPTAKNALCANSRQLILR